MACRQPSRASVSSCLHGKEEWQCAAVEAILGSNAHDGGGGTVISAAGVCNRAQARMWSPHEGQPPPSKRT